MGNLPSRCNRRPDGSLALGWSAYRPLGCIGVVSSSPVILGQLRSRRARLRFPNRLHAKTIHSRSARKLPPAAYREFFPCLTQGVHPNKFAFVFVKLFCMLHITNRLQFQLPCRPERSLAALCETESKDPERAGCVLGAGALPRGRWGVEFVGRKVPAVVLVWSASGSFDCVWRKERAKLRSG
jgi:hypothetical protein